MNYDHYLLSYPQTQRFLFFAVCDGPSESHFRSLTTHHPYRTRHATCDPISTRSLSKGPGTQLETSLITYHTHTPSLHDPQIFAFKTYHTAARACSRLRGQGNLGVRLIITWASGMQILDIEALSLRENYRDAAFFRARLLFEPTRLQDRERLVMELDWMDEVVQVAGPKGSVQVPKHVLDHRSADGDSDVWGKLQRGLVDEIYLTKGKMDFVGAGLLLEGMTKGYETGLDFEG